MRASGHSLLASYFRVVCDKKQVRSFETSFNSVVPFTYKSRNFSSLQPLGVSWLSFRDPNRLFSMVCSLFCQNRGVGIPPSDHMWGLQAKWPLLSLFIRYNRCSVRGNGKRLAAPLPLGSPGPLAVNQLTSPGYRYPCGAHTPKTQ